MAHANTKLYISAKIEGGGSHSSAFGENSTHFGETYLATYARTRYNAMVDSEDGARRVRDTSNSTARLYLSREGADGHVVRFVFYRFI